MVSTNILWFLCVILLFVNCSGESEKTEDIEHRIDIEDATKIDVEFVLSSKKVIPIETTSESVLGPIDDIVANDEYIFIVSLRNVFQFDTKGNFVRVVCRQGRGPNEMIDVRGAVLENDILYLQDYGGKILAFGMNGDLMSNVTLTEGDFIGFYPSSDDSFWIHYYIYSNGNSSHYLSLVDNCMQLKGSWQPKDVEGMHIVEPETYFVENSSGELFYYHHTTNVVYKLADSNAKAEFVFDLGENAPDYQLISTLSNDQDINNAFINNYRVSAIGFLGNYLLFKFGECKPQFVSAMNWNGIYDIQNHKTYIVENALTWEMPFYNYGVVDNGIVRYNYASVSRLKGQRRVEIEEMCGKKLSDDDNPILLVDTIYDLKFRLK